MLFQGSKKSLFSSKHDWINHILAGFTSELKYIFLKKKSELFFVTTLTMQNMLFRQKCGNISAPVKVFGKMCCPGHGFKFKYCLLKPHGVKIFNEPNETVNMRYCQPFGMCLLQCLWLLKTISTQFLAQMSLKINQWASKHNQMK